MKAYVIAQTGAYPGLAVPASIHLPKVKSALGLKRIRIGSWDTIRVDRVDREKLG